MIRKAHLNDLNRIFDIRLEASHRLNMQGVNQWQSEKPTIDDFKGDIKDESCFVFEKNNVVYGMVTLLVTYDESYIGVVSPEVESVTMHRMAVSNDATHEGIGHALMTFAQSYALSLQKEVILVDTHPENIYMQQLIASHQFEFVTSIFLQDIPSPKRYLYRKSLTKC